VLGPTSTHTRRSLVRQCGETRADALWSRFTLHPTPKHGSWLNQAEIEISIFGRQCLWNKAVNRQRLTINWTFTRLDAANVSHQQLKLFKRSGH
jgi:hypothetical protein